ncbi:MAG: DUF1573 domain-containing protein [Deltaproteobacteria bacterium]
MRSKVLWSFLLGWALFAGGTRAWAQDPQWAQKMFDKLEVDFGNVPSGADLKQRLKVTNKYEQTVHILGIASSCGCTAGKPAKDTLASGESTDVDITMNTRKFSLLKETVVTVTFDQPLLTSVRIPVRAFINPEVLINPGAAEFGQITKGTDALRKLAIVYAWRGTSTIKEAVSKNPNVVAQLVEARRDAAAIHYELHVTIRGTSPLGDLRDQVTLVTDNPNNPNIPVLVEARIEPEYAVSPELVSFGTLVPGERKTLNIVARGKKPFLIEKIESEKTAGVFEVRLPKEPKTVHVLPLTMIAPAEPGSVSEEFTLTISGIPDPVTFKVHGKVAAPTGTPATFVPGNP